MKISTIIFDLGKVLVDYDLSTAIRKVAAKSSLDEKQISSALKTSSRIIAYAKGELSTEQFFPLLIEELQFTGTAAELEETWCDIFSPIDEHIEYARALANYYPLALLSNTDDSHIRFLESRYDFFNIFREKIYSFQAGLIKPDKAIYDLALEKMKADKYETLFIDDLEENILVPSKMGWQTIHLRPDVNLRHALMSYDLKGIL